MELGSFIIKRLSLMVLVIFGVLIIVFIVTRIIPADPVGAILGGNAPPATVDAMRHQLGLDKPIFAQLLDYLGGILRGNLGNSLVSGRPVMTDIMEFLPATIELAISSIIFAVVLGVILGLLSAVFRNRFIDHFSRVFSILGISLPGFWLGLIMILIFYYRLGWLPNGGQYDMFLFPTRTTGLILLDAVIHGEWDVFFNGLKHLILPTFILGYSSTASIARIMRASMLDVLHQNYIRTARAKGLPRKVVILRHALKNALIPVITIIGLEFGGLLSGAVLTETIFSWPGLGRYIVNSLLTLDYPAISGGTIFIALIYSVVNLAVDILYAAVDPRMRS
jgi:peptide/nickel transport system permease protein